MPPLGRRVQTRQTAPSSKESHEATLSFGPYSRDGHRRGRSRACAIARPVGDSLGECDAASARLAGSWRWNAQQSKRPAAHRSSLACALAARSSRRAAHAQTVGVAETVGVAGRDAERAADPVELEQHPAVGTARPDWPRRCSGRSRRLTGRSRVAVHDFLSASAQHRFDPLSPDVDR